MQKTVTNVSMKKRDTEALYTGSAKKTVLIVGALIVLCSLIAYQQYSLNQIRALVSGNAISLPVAPQPAPFSTAERKEMVREDFLKLAPYLSGTIVSQAETFLEIEALVPNIDTQVAFMMGETREIPTKEDLVRKRVRVTLDSETEYPLGSLDTFKQGATFIIWPRNKAVYPLDPKVTSFTAGYVYPAIPGITVDAIGANL